MEFQILRPFYLIRISQNLSFVSYAASTLVFCVLLRRRLDLVMFVSYDGFLLPNVSVDKGSLWRFHLEFESREFLRSGFLTRDYRNSSGSPKFDFTGTGTTTKFDFTDLT